MTNQTIIIRFDGNYFSYPDSNGNTIKITAISGKTDSQNSQFQSVLDKGPIPEGLYSVKQNEYQSIGIADIFAGLINWGAWPKSFPAWGTERVWLQPQAGTETFGRTDFSIHGGLSVGSAGCIDLVSNASTFFSFFKSLGEDVVLQVDYGAGYDGSNNPLTNGVSDITIEDIYSSQGLDLNELEPLKFLENQVKTQLEQQLQMSIPDQSLNQILKQYSFSDTSKIENLLTKYNLNSNLNDYSSSIPTIIINDGNGNNFNLSAFPDFSVLLNQEIENSLDQFTTSFLDSALVPFDYDLEQFNDFLNSNQLSLNDFKSEFGESVFGDELDSEYNFSSSFDKYFEQSFLNDLNLNTNLFDVELSSEGGNYEAEFFVESEELEIEEPDFQNYNFSDREYAKLIAQ